MLMSAVLLIYSSLSSLFWPYLYHLVTETLGTKNWNCTKSKVSMIQGFSCIVRHTYVHMYSQLYRCWWSHHGPTDTSVVMKRIGRQAGCFIAPVVLLVSPSVLLFCGKLTPVVWRFSVGTDGQMKSRGQLINQGWTGKWSL